MKMTSK